MKGNLFSLPVDFDISEEFLQTLFSGEDIRLERIISTGHTTPEGEWFDQEKDEWVLLLEGRAEILYESGEETEMVPGDWIFIPAHRKHRVTFTSSEPRCFWLALHGSITMSGRG